MSARKLHDLSLIALITSYFLQFGAQLFAIAVIVRTVIAAPPRSFRLFEGPYGYDSSAFWNIVPASTLVLFVTALIANWRSQRRNMLLGAFALFLLAGVVAGFYLEPTFAALRTIGYSDSVDPELQRRAAMWYTYDIGAWLLGLVGGVVLLVALARPATDR